MPAKVLSHDIDIVKDALIHDGWSITHDPFTLAYGLRKVFVDLGAERTLAAEKEGRKIAVEVKTFLGASDLRDLENALGQYVFYRSLLARVEPDRRLYLAVPEDVFDSTFSEPIARPPLEDLGVSLFAFDPGGKRIVRWTN